MAAKLALLIDHAAAPSTTVIATARAAPGDVTLARPTRTDPARLAAGTAHAIPRPATTARAIPGPPSGRP